MPIVEAGSNFMKCREYVDVAVSIVQDAIDHREDWIDDARHDDRGWKLTVNKRNMQVFRHKSSPALLPSESAATMHSQYRQPSPHGSSSTSSNSASSCTFLTVGYLTTTIDELHTALYATTSVDDQVMHSLLLEKEFMTSHVLQSLTETAPPSLDPHLPDFCGIKYIKMRSRFGMHPREAVYLEYLTLREDNTLVKVVYSVNNYLPLHKDHHRAVLRDVWLFMPAPNGKIQVVAKTFHDMPGSKLLNTDQSALSFWCIYDKLTSLSYIRRLLSSTGALGGRNSVSELARSLPATLESFQRAANGHPSNVRSHCQCCRRKFTLFHGKRFTCAQCDMTMCSNCHLRVVYAVQASLDPTPLDQLHATAMTVHNNVICLVCVHRSKETFSDFIKVKAPEIDDDAWEAAQGNNVGGRFHTSSHATFKDATVSSYSTEGMRTPPPLTHHFHTAPHPHSRAGSLPASAAGTTHRENDDVFQEMRKSIAIQESILSAMRASWHGHTEQEQYVQQQPHQRPSEFTFDRDSDRFEEVVE
ncbi:hypothetical protein H257_03738 [Aphanomyces astaci]|uniref:FYVE-type domain-containing protein n=1 Tax=Aphanomyces astaci TaxID=112090 RepID=W4GY50_APHAT|nr:hypothetical protein H257_03738 [Aphanomyces astaci]ETV84567.1 hypothetical protein H257_03738 [Aphanomyces astaci]|eukprot:XP_009826259.1 hypothetical protein H257_03738 [Aphanomyces astaci]